MGFVISLRAAQTNSDKFLFRLEIISKFSVFTANISFISAVRFPIKSSNSFHSAIYYQGSSSLDPESKGINYIENFAHSPICEDAKENPFSMFSNLYRPLKNRPGTIEKAKGMLEDEMQWQ